MAHVLVVDDEPIVLTVLERTLTKPGWTIHTATSITTALDTADEIDQLDVAIIDKNLGSAGNGLDLIPDLRQRHPFLEIIIITGFANTESAIQAARLRVFDYVTKPIVDLRAIELKVGNAIDKAYGGHERERLTGELKQAEEHYRQLFHAVTDGILIFDPTTGTIEEINLAVEFLYGYGRSELIGRARADLHTEARGETAGVPGPVRERRKDGSTFYADIATSPVSVAGRELRIDMVRDITAAILAEKERREREATAHQRERLEALGRLAGGIAHDFNNILTIIDANARFLCDETELGDQAKDDVQQILVANESGVRMTRQLLTLGRQNLGRHGAFDVVEVVRELEPVLRTAVGEAIELAFNLDPGPKLVQGERVQFEQLLINLVVNARDAMVSNGAIEVGVVEELTDELTDEELGTAPRPSVRLTVTDQGRGIDATTVSHIFDPFFTTKEEGRGTGLGLATVRAVVDQLRGAIGVESAIGQGTTFTVHLPIAERDPDSLVVKPVASDAPRPQIDRVLVVEDDPGVRRVVCRMLAAEGIAVETAADGVEALALVMHHGDAFDIVLTDVTMPRMNGPELVQRLADHGCAAPVCFMTSHGMAVLRRFGLDTDSISLLPKPFTLPDLLAALSAAKRSKMT